MLQKWRLRRFKSVYDKTELAMGPLTIFAGVNNSGKSTVIQSILLTAQSLQTPVQERPITLNGHILRLGTFDDIVSSGHESDEIHIGFELGQLSEIEVRLRSGQRRPLPSRWRRTPDTMNSIRCDFTFSSKGTNNPKEILQLQPNLQTSNLQTTVRSDDQLITANLVVRRRDGDLNKFATELELTDALSRDLEALEYEVLNTPAAAPSYPGYFASGENVGAALFHFLPRALLIRYDSIEEHAKQITESFISEPNPWQEELESEEFATLPQDFKKRVLQTCIDLKKRLPDAVPRKDRFAAAFDDLQRVFTADNYRKFLSKFSSAERTVALRALVEQREALVRIARQDAPPVYRTRYQPLAEPLDFVADFVATFFQDYVKYLAPLRDEPKPVYPLSGSTDPTDVGFKGEHTAAVLELNRHRMIQYISPSDLVDAVAAPRITAASLEAAVLDWLQYMGVVSMVRTSDRGASGHELKVATNDPACLRDLTHVGVGVSQVLPIVVLALIADRGSTLIFEQPELHLHPSVQSRLADFFLSMMLLRKQCIVETHSEHLINRLRQRIASSDQPQLAQGIVIYFVEATEGKSHYKQIEITPTGSIRNWPKGFFDEGEELAAGILRSAVRKRSRLDKVNE